MRAYVVVLIIHPHSHARCNAVSVFTCHKHVSAIQFAKNAHIAECEPASSLRRILRSLAGYFTVRLNLIVARATLSARNKQAAAQFVPPLYSHAAAACLAPHHSIGAAGESFRVIR